MNQKSKKLTALVAILVASAASGCSTDISQFAVGEVTTWKCDKEPSSKKEYVFSRMNMLSKHRPTLSGLAAQMNPGAQPYSTPKTLSKNFRQDGYSVTAIPMRLPMKGALPLAGLPTMVKADD